MKRFVLFLILSCFPISMFANESSSTSVGDNNFVACTMEAKLCPDGKTWVGRSGPSCDFQACPGDTSLPVACTEEAKICSDGSSVSRTGPNCEFAQCPDEKTTPKPCTREYRPVCAQPPMPICPEGMACIQVMPIPSTYSNSCTMENAGAELLYEGVCKDEGDDDSITLPDATDTKYYVGDIKTCRIIKFSCRDDWGYFSDDRGCGCEKTQSLSDRTIKKIDIRLNTFYDILEERFASSEEIIGKLEDIIDKLEEIAEKNKKYETLVTYVIDHIYNYIQTLDDHVIDDILEIIE